MSDIRTIDPRTTTRYVGVSGRHAVLSATLTRPAGTASYTALDVMAPGTPASSALEFGSAAIVNGGGGVIVSALCVDSAKMGTVPPLKLYLFSGSPTVQADNAAWAPSDADLQDHLIGEIAFSVWTSGIVTAGTAGNLFSKGSAVSGEPLVIPYQCDSTSRSIFGVPVMTAAYDPAVSEVFTFKLGVVED